MPLTNTEVRCQPYNVPGDSGGENVGQGDLVEPTVILPLGDFLGEVSSSEPCWMPPKAFLNAFALLDHLVLEGRATSWCLYLLA